MASMSQEVFKQIRIFKSMSGMFESTDEEDQDYDLRTKILSVRDYIWIALTIIMCPISISHQSKLILHSGPVLYLIIYITLSVLISLPILAILNFLGSYSKLSYVQFWDTMFLLKGFGISLTINKFLIIMELMRNALRHYDLILKYMAYYNWMHCSFDGRPEEKICVPHNSVLGNCTDRGLKNIPSVLMTNMFFDKINLSSTLGLLAFWFITTCIVIRKLSKVKNTLVAIQMFCSTCLAFVVVAVLANKPNYTGKTILSINSKSLLDTTVIADYIFVIVNPMDFGCILWINSFKPDKLSATKASVYLTMIKIICNILLACGTVTTLQQLQLLYGITDVDCLTKYKKRFLMALLPDYIGSGKGGTLYILVYHISVMVMNIICSAYSVIAAIDLILCHLRPTKRIRLWLALIMCPIVYLLNVVISIVLPRNLMRHYGLAIAHVNAAFLVLCALSIVFAYSIEKIITDFHFKYGYPPGAVWHTLPKYIVIFVLLSTSVLIQNMLSGVAIKGGKGFESITFFIGLILLVMSPVLINLIRTSFKILTGQRLPPRRIPTWGPDDFHERIRRLKFIPKRQVRYRNDGVTCKHMCLVRLSYQGTLDDLRLEQKATYMRMLEKLEAYRLQRSVDVVKDADEDEDDPSSTETYFTDLTDIKM